MDMQRIITVALIVWLFGYFAQAQSPEVSIQFTHMAGENELPLNEFFETPTGTQVKIDRFSWYGSFPMLIMANEEEVPCEQEYFIFRMDRGKQHLTARLSNPGDIKAIRFYAGVDSLHNHMDPSTYPPTHPLAHQNPTMHWGWISGYIFQAFEGKTRKPGMNEESFFIHSIGNSLYRPVEIPVFPVEQEDGNWRIDINIDLLRLIGQLEMHGLIAMGDFDENVYLFSQLQEPGVFYDPNEPSSSVKNPTLADMSALRIYPNPARGQVSAFFASGNHPGAVRLSLFNALGNKVSSQILPMESSGENIDLPAQPGIYLLHFQFADGSTSSEKLMVR
jgi:hypothetical protein